MTEVLQLPFVGLLLLYTGFFSLRTLVIAGGMTWLVTRTRFAQARRVYRLAYGRGQLQSELVSAVKVILLDALIIAAFLRLGGVELAPATLTSSLLTFALLFLWYEVWFYATHRLLHTRALYFLHAQHHTAKVAHPLTSLSFSIAERLILQLGAVGFVAVASALLPISAPGLFGYFLVNYALNVVGHSNVEWFPERYPRSGAGKLLISVSFHAMHHARYQGHYGLFTQVLDRAFGTYFPDYPEVHARAARGEGMTSLGERP